MSIADIPFEDNIEEKFPEDRFEEIENGTPKDQQEDKELQIKRKIEPVVQKMQQLQVRNDEEFSTADKWLQKCRDTEKIIDETFNDELEAAKDRKKKAEAEREAVAQKIDQFKKPLKEASNVVKRMLAEYQAEVERKQREEEERRRKKEEEQRKKAEAEGKPAPTPAPVAEKKEPPKASGAVFYEDWNFEIEDPTKIPREYLEINEKKIRQVVKAMKGDTNIPGVRVYSEKKARYK